MPGRHLLQPARLPPLKDNRLNRTIDLQIYPPLAAPARHQQHFPSPLRTQQQPASPQTKLTHPQTKLTRPQIKLVHPQTKLVHPQTKLVHPQIPQECGRLGIFPWRQRRSYQHLLHLRGRLLPAEIREWAESAVDSGYNAGVSPKHRLNLPDARVGGPDRPPQQFQRHAVSFGWSPNKKLGVPVRLELLCKRTHPRLRGLVFQFQTQVLGVLPQKFGAGDSLRFGQRPQKARIQAVQVIRAGILLLRAVTLAPKSQPLQEGGYAGPFLSARQGQKYALKNADLYKDHLREIQEEVSRAKVCQLNITGFFKNKRCFYL